MKKVLYVILAITLIYLVCCLIGPSIIVVQRSATINASSDVIKSQITDYNVFNKWSPWQEKDTAMKTSVEGEAGKVGHKYYWEGNKQVGKGTMEFTFIGADSIVEKLVFDGRGASDVSFALKANGAETNVNWALAMNVPFIGRGMMMFMKGHMEKNLGGDFEKGLAKLKTVAESQTVAAPTANYEVKEVNWDERTFFGTKHNTLAEDKIGVFLGENLSKIRTDLEKNKIEMASAPACIYFNHDEAGKTVECAAALGVGKGKEVKGWEKYTIPAGKVLQVDYFGAYDKMSSAHDAIKKYIAEKGLTKVMTIEEYMNDPMNEKDTAKWQTNIYYIVK